MDEQRVGLGQHHPSDHARDHQRDDGRHPQEAQDFDDDQVPLVFLREAPAVVGIAHTGRVDAGQHPLAQAPVQPRHRAQHTEAQHHPQRQHGDLQHVLHYLGARRGGQRQVLAIIRRAEVAHAVVIDVVAVDDPGHQQRDAHEQVPRAREPLQFTVAEMDDLVDERAGTEEQDGRSQQFEQCQRTPAGRAEVQHGERPGTRGTEQEVRPVDQGRALLQVIDDFARLAGPVRRGLGGGRPGHFHRRRREGKGSRHNATDYLCGRFLPSHDLLLLRPGPVF